MPYTESNVNATFCCRLTDAQTARHKSYDEQIAVSQHEIRRLRLNRERLAETSRVRHFAALPNNSKDFTRDAGVGGLILRHYKVLYLPF